LRYREKLPMSYHALWGLAVSAVGVAVLGLWAGGGLGQAPKADPPRGATKGDLKPAYFGVKACAGGCHDQKEPQAGALCRRNESVIWQREDKHGKAYEVLTGKRADKMRELLGIKGKLTEEKQCLSCHGVVRIPGTEVDEDSFKPEDGVSCVVCHGTAKNWIVFHGVGLNKKEWRGLTPPPQETDFGRTDLRDPRQRAALCASRPHRHPT